MFSFQNLAEFLRNQDQFSSKLQRVKCVQAKFHRWQQPSKNGNYTLKIANGQEGLLILMDMP